MQKTAYEMRISDWSSDVCSSDLAVCIDGELRSLLGALGRALPGRVALVSGHSIAQLDEMLGEIDPTLAYAGSHGSERRWHDGALHLPVRAAGLNSGVRSEERRVGQECGSTCRSAWVASQYKKKQQKYRQ